MRQRNIRRSQKLDHRTEESLLVTNRLLRDEVVSLMLDIAILREASAGDGDARTLACPRFDASGERGRPRR